METYREKKNKNKVSFLTLVLTGTLFGSSVVERDVYIANVTCLEGKCKKGGETVLVRCVTFRVFFFFSFLWHSTGETKTATASYFREKKTWFCSPKDQIQHRSHSHGARGVGRKKKRNEITHWFSSSDSTIALISRTFFLFFFFYTFYKKDWS